MWSIITIKNILTSPLLTLMQCPESVRMGSYVCWSHFKNSKGRLSWNKIKEKSYITSESTFTFLNELQFIFESHLLHIIQTQCYWTVGLVNLKLEKTDLIKITGSSNWSNFICVINKANTGLRQTISFTNLYFSKTSDKLLPDISSKSTSSGEANFMRRFLCSLSTNKAKS